MAASDPSPSLPRHVRLFGADHSPWVQAVLLGLHARGIPHEYAVAPSPGLFLSSGIFMPAVRIDDGPWVYDSASILQRLGFSEVKPDDATAMARLFTTGAFERTGSATGFWSAWSTVTDGSASSLRRLLHQFLKPIAVLTFFTMITLARLRIRGATPERKRAAFEYFEAQLADGRAFFGGAEPDTVDLQLFGQVQMQASIPGQTLEILLEATELDGLRAWAGRMHARFAAYPHLYSGPLFEPRLPAPAEAPVADRIAYWLGCATMLVTLPLALLVSLFSILRVGQRGLRARR